jgi:bacterioferritin-associated ferredoxin
MIVCICKSLTESTIKEMLTYTDFEGIQQMTGACTQCCKCKQEFERITNQICNGKSDK